MPEAIPSADTVSMLDTQWNSSNVTEPTYVDVNSGTAPQRIDFRQADYAVVSVDSPAIEEQPIGPWIYGNRTTRVVVELYTANSRQRLYDLMAEVRRICHARMHSETNYQRIQFQSFNEFTETAQLVWIGRILIELVNNAVLLET